MKAESEKITLPKGLQREVIKFFLKTSIPRKKRAQALISSENKTDGSEEK